MTVELSVTKSAQAVNSFIRYIEQPVGGGYVFFQINPIVVELVRSI